MKKLFIALYCANLTVFGYLLSGCSASTGTLTRDPVAFLQINGVKENLTATVDDLAPIALVANARPITLQLAPGKHRIRIQRGSVLLVDREILVSDQQTLEIPVP